jgi:hypothetical protein
LHAPSLHLIDIYMRLQGLDLACKPSWLQPNQSKITI